MAAVTDFSIGDTCVFSLDPCLTLMSAILILYFTNVSSKTFFLRLEFTEIPLQTLTTTWRSTSSVLGHSR